MRANGSDILKEAAKTFTEREAVYGSEGYRVQGAVLKALFPEGIELLTPTDFNRFYLMNMVITKLVRYAANINNGGHQDSLRDMAVYSAILEAFDENEREVL